LIRPIHNDDTLYWLNPVSAGISTCLRVHNLKSQGIRNLLNIKAPKLLINENLNLNEVLEIIKFKVNEYEKELKKSNLDKDVSELIEKIDI